MQLCPRAVALSSRRIGRRPIVVVRRERRAIPSSLPLHLSDLRIGYFQSVFDRIASAVQSALQTDSVVGMARDFLSPSVSFIHDGFQLIDRQRGLRHEVPLLVHPGPVRHIDFQPVRAVLELFARRLSRFYRAVDQLCALGHIQFRGVALQVVASRRRNSAR